MRGPISLEDLQAIARNAGFEFNVERAALLLPQLEGILEGASQVEAATPATTEPAIVFRPRDLWGPTGEKAAADG